MFLVKRGHLYKLPLQECIVNTINFSMLATKILNKKSVTEQTQNFQLFE